MFGEEYQGSFPKKHFWEGGIEVRKRIYSSKIAATILAKSIGGELLLKFMN
jgi:hypothetical protein